MKIHSYKPIFTVITPTYNRCYILWRAIQSVLGQTFPFFEFLIIDDASTDDTERQVKIFTDPRIRYFKLKKNKGPAAARNYGLKKARGEYVAYLDSDNEWNKEFLEVMHNGFLKNKDKVLFFCKKNYRLILTNEKGERKSIRDEFSNHRKYFDLKRLWHRRILIDTNTMCHKRKDVIKLGGWDEKLGFWEDWELTLRISEKYPKGFMYLNRTLLNYEQEIDLTKAWDIFKFWEKEETKIFKKYKGNTLLEGQNWFPPQKGNKSTLGVIEYLKNKKK